MLVGFLWSLVGSAVGGASLGVELLSAQAADGPRLVVQIVVPQLSTADLDSHAEHLCQGGFRRLMSGVAYEQALYDFAPTMPSALATLTTGALPSEHGIIGEGWWSHSTEQWQGVVADKNASSYGCDSALSRVSNKNLTMPTVGDMLLWSNPESRVVSVAADASSAIIMGGRAAEQVWWLDSLSGRWTTSTKYLASLPKWVRNFNGDGLVRRQMGRPWILSKHSDCYSSPEVAELRPKGYKLTKEENKRKTSSEDIRLSAYSYLSNESVVQFAKEATIYNRLGGDEHVDLLMVSFDAMGRIAERYGRNSRQWEDALYRLDEQLAEMMNFISAQSEGRVTYLLVSDGQAVPTAAMMDAKRFNASQFSFLVGSFMSASFGNASWVLGYDNGGLWLNRMLLLSNGMDVADVQRKVAAFGLQFGGVANVFCAADMASMATKSGPAQRVQNGHYAARSADLQIVLMPSYVECENDSEPMTKAGKGTIYARRSVLYVAGDGVAEGRRVVRKVDLCSVAPTVAYLLGVETPMGADSEPLEEVVER